MEDASNPTGAAMAIGKLSMKMTRRTCVLLGLILALGVIAGVVIAQKWRDGAKRSDCIVYIHQYQIAVRSWAGVNEIPEGHPLHPVDVAQYCGTIRTRCKSGGTYHYRRNYSTHQGMVFVTCDCNIGGKHQPGPERTTSW